MTPHLPAAITTAICTAALLSSCSSNGDSPPPLEGKLASIQAHIFTATCATSSCHSSTVHAGNLVLESGKSYAQLVGVFAENAAARNAAIKRVDAGKPDSSFLFIKIQKVTNADYGQTMPTNRPNGLAADQLAAIKVWIEGGAKND